MSNEAKTEKTGSLKAQRLVSDIVVHAILAIMAVIWVIPLVWLVLISFRGEAGNNVTTFFPKSYTLANYIKLFTDRTVIDFPRMFINTLIISIFSCLISTFFVLSVAFSTSRLRWRMRKAYMNMAMVITLFPGFMSMMAVYFILKSMGLTEGSMIPIALIIVFSSGAGTGFYVMKGYMDTIPFALDEAAMLDGATRWQVFTKITLPLCKPMIVYQIITAFLGPWVDFIFAKIICRTSVQYYTVSIGLYTMLEKEYVFNWFNSFAAGAVLISIPISILFISMQKCYQEAMGGAVKG
jgi:arabinogalactan oligomer/maltooligosaccharide transport system permease protein